jgi:hypothetical protein
MLTPKEQAAKEFMYTNFIPHLHAIIIEKNLPEYEKWGGNCCRQSAIIGAKMLEKLLPGYKFEVWDGWFKDVVRGREVEYNHAWIFGTSPDKRRLLIDLSRIFHERLFIEVKHNQYPKTGTYKFMREKRREKFNWKKMFDIEREYYTKQPSRFILDEIMRRSGYNG